MQAVWCLRCCILAICWRFPRHGKPIWVLCFAEDVGLVGVEGVTVEAADASGGAALRMAYLAVRSGAVKAALAVGVEKYTDVIGANRKHWLPICWMRITKRPKA
jgi:hypothetical protein